MLNTQNKMRVDWLKDGGVRGEIETSSKNHMEYKNVANKTNP